MIANMTPSISGKSATAPSLASLVAGFLAALGATACCFGPLLLVTLGAGGAWASSLRALEPYQPVFTLLTLTFIGFAFYRFYIQPRQCAPGDLCALPAVMRRQRIAFWLVVIVVAAMFAFPLYAPLFY